MAKFYVETGNGRCCIQEAPNRAEAREAVLREVGTVIGVSAVRKATPFDIAWVCAMSMGGRNDA